MFIAAVYIKCLYLMFMFDVYIRDNENFKYHPIHIKYRAINNIIVYNDYLSIIYDLRFKCIKKLSLYIITNHIV